MAVLLNKIRMILIFMLRQKSKKVKASTLVEVLVASVLIIVIFTIASLSLNNVFKSTIKSNTAVIENELNKLYYLYQYQKINSNYVADFGDWEIRVIKQGKNRGDTVLLKAINSKTEQIITKKVLDETIQ